MASTSAQQAGASLVQGETSTVDRRRRLQDLGLVMLVGFAQLVVFGIYVLFVPAPAFAGYSNPRLVNGLIHETATLTLFLCLLRRQGRTLATVGLAFDWKDIPQGVGLFLLSYVGSHILLRHFQLAYFFWNGHYFQFRDSAALDAGASLTLYLTYAFAAPFFEETLVRGYLMTELTESFCPAWMAVIASIILQTSYHLYYGVAGALYLSFGFAVSAIYFALSRKLWPVILSHLFWNLTAVYLR